MMYNNTAFQPRRRRRFPLVGILILLIVFGGIGFLVNRVRAGNVITVDSGTTLFVDSCSGFVHIHANTTSNQVVIQGLNSIFAPPVMHKTATRLSSTAAIWISRFLRPSI